MWVCLSVCVCVYVCVGVCVVVLTGGNGGIKVKQDQSVRLGTRFTGGFSDNDDDYMM